MEYVKAKELDEFTITKFVDGKQNQWGKTEYKVEIDSGKTLDLSASEMGSIIAGEVKTGRFSDDEGRLTFDIVGRKYAVKHIEKEADFGQGMKQFTVNYFNEVA